MLHAAAMLAGLFALAMLLTQGWVSRDAALLAFSISLVSLGAAMRLGGVKRNPFSAPQFAVLIASQLGALVQGTLTTIRAAVAADVTLKPALVRVRAEGENAFAKAAAADLISAVPSRVVVETDADGMLVHVNDEDASDSAALTAVQRRAATLLGGRA